MFIKLLKYDFSFSARIFLAMAAVLLSLAAILRLTMPMFVEIGSAFELSMAANMVMSLLLLSVGIASITQIFQFFNRNFFGESGYLMLTVPLGRLRLLVSKVLVSMVWFNFMVVAAVASMFIMWETAHGAIHGSPFWRIRITDVLGAIEVNVLALFAISMLFFCLTLARSVFMNKRVHGVICGIIGAAYTWLFFGINAFVGSTRRVVEIQEFEMFDGSIHYFETSVPLLGLRYGRIALDTEGLWPIYIDILRHGIAVGMALAALALTYYLLSRRVALR